MGHERLAGVVDAVSDLEVTAAREIGEGLTHRLADNVAADRFREGVVHRDVEVVGSTSHRDLHARSAEKLWEPAPLEHCFPHEVQVRAGLAKGRAVSHCELPQEMGYVHLHRLFRKAKLRRDLLVLLAAQHELEDLTLARGQVKDRACPTIVTRSRIGCAQRNEFLTTSRTPAGPAA